MKYNLTDMSDPMLDVDILHVLTRTRSSSLPTSTTMTIETEHMSSVLLRLTFATAQCGTITIGQHEHSSCSFEFACWSLGVEIAALQLQHTGF